MVPDLSINLGKTKLDNPVLTASGTFGYGEEFQEFVNLNRLGGIVTKSITPRPRIGNPPHRLVEVPGGMLNAIGLANVGVEKFISEKMPFLSELKCKVIVNVAGESINEYESVIARLAEVEDHFAGYEINLSCPNVKEGGLTFGKDAGQVFKITSALRKLTDKMLIIKLTPNVSDIGELGLAAQEAGGDVLSAINTFVGLAVNVEKRRPVLGNITGGFSGPALKSLALAKIWELKNTVSIPIIGIGGIFTHKDVLEFMLVGASAVQIGTANFVEPDVSQKIVGDLEKYCSGHQISQITELIGSLETRF